MRFIPCKTAIILFLLAVTGLARGFTLPRQLYDIKPSIGARLNGSYQFGKELKEAIDYGIGAEVLFPVYRNIGLRTQLLELSILAGNESILLFNTGLSLDGVFAFSSRRLRVGPYLYGGAGFQMVDDNLGYQIRAGAGLEARLARSVRFFGEAGIGHSGEQTELRLCIGTRFRKAQ